MALGLMIVYFCILVCVVLHGTEMLTMVCFRGLRVLASHVMLHGNCLRQLPFHITLGKGAPPPLHPWPERL